MKNHILFFSGACWGATGGGQRPQQLALHLRAPERQVVHVVDGEAHNGGQPIYDRGVTVSDLSKLDRRWIEDSVAICCIPKLSVEPALLQVRAVVYDCLDLWSEMPDNQCWYDPDLERMLFQRADVVTASSGPLVSQATDIGRRNDVTLLPNGGPREPYAPQPAPERLVLGEKTLVCASYIGGPWWDWWAVDEIDDVCTRRGWHLNLVGPVENSGPQEGWELPEERLSATSLVGPVPWSELGAWLVNADAAVIPFMDTPLIRAVDPIKAYENAAAALPTVASHGLQELRGRPNVYHVPSGGDWEPLLLEALARPRHMDAEWVRRNSWAARAAQLWELIQHL